MQKTVTIALLREGKTPPDERVAFLPEQCNNAIAHFPKLNFVVQPSPVRCINDNEYTAAGFRLEEDLSAADYLMGIKEVPVKALLPGKTYLFFSHTVKMQPYNQKLLAEVLNKKITLIDYELVTNTAGKRTVAFGKYAGLAGAYHGIRAYGLKYGLFNIPAPRQCGHLAVMRNNLAGIVLPAIKIVVTGTGRVGTGAMEILEWLGIEKVSPASFLEKTYPYAVYTQLGSAEYHAMADGSPFDTEHFHWRPQGAVSTFERFARVADVLMATAYWDPKAPRLFSKEDMRQPWFKIKLIADITCDIDGSIPSTIRSSTIENPLYDYNPVTEQEEAFNNQPGNVSVMAVDNLPCELPADASADFAGQLLDNLLPHLLGNDSEGVIERATIARNGQLTQRFEYLQDYAEGKL